MGDPANRGHVGASADMSVVFFPISLRLAPREWFFACLGTLVGGKDKSVRLGTLVGMLWVFAPTRLRFVLREWSRTLPGVSVVRPLESGFGVGFFVISGSLAIWSLVTNRAFSTRSFVLSRF